MERSQGALEYLLLIGGAVVVAAVVVVGILSISDSQNSATKLAAYETQMKKLAPFNMEGYYKLDDSALDSAPKNNNATVIGVTFVNDPERGQVASFNGSSYIEIPRIDLTPSGETVSLWVKHNGSSNILFHEDAWDRRIFGTGITFVSEYPVGTVDAGPYYRTLPTTGSNDNKWHHVAYTVSGTEVKSYVDGTMVNQQTLLTNMRSSTSKWWVGRLCGGSSCANYYTGQIDELVFINRALSDSEIRTMALK